MEWLIPERTVRVTDTVTAVASCSYCAWQAQHRGPALEVSCFLRALVLAHVHDRHAEVEALGGQVEVLDTLRADLAKGATDA
jgi:hypothetical protein